MIGSTRQVSVFAFGAPADLRKGFVESAKLCDVDPKRYLKEAAVAAIRDREILLPHHLRS